MTGAVHDTTVRRIRMKYGLDLQGGMHLALELDQSKQVSSNVKRDIDLALVVLRKRIEGIGTQEPLIQKSGDERIVVELAGISDPARAKAVVQQSAFLDSASPTRPARWIGSCRPWIGCSGSSA